MNFCIVAQNLRLKWSQKYSARPNYAVLRMVLWVHFVELITRWKAERKSTFHIHICAHIYKEMQFLYIYTHTCIYSQQDTCQYKKCICMQWYWSFPLHGNRADWDLILSWKKNKNKKQNQIWESDRGELKSYLFHRGEVLYYRQACRNTPGCSEGMQSQMLRCVWAPNGRLWGHLPGWASA